MLARVSSTRELKLARTAPKNIQRKITSTGPVRLIPVNGETALCTGAVVRKVNRHKAVFRISMSQETTKKKIRLKNTTKMEIRT